MEKEKKYANRIDIAGYLKENGLKKSLNQQHAEIISGTLTVYVGDGVELKVNCYANRFKKAVGGAPAEENKFYKQFEKLLDENTVSVEKILKMEPASTMEQVLPRATIVHMFGSMRENIFTNREGETVVSTRLRAIGGEVVDALPANFSPYATFELGGYIDSIKPEIKSGEETGRLVVKMIAIDDYDGSAQEFTLVTGSDDVAGYLDSNYAPTNCATLRGDIYATVRKTLQSSGAASFGRAATDVYSTEFIQEFRIMGGDETPKVQGDDGCYSIEMVTTARTIREEKMNNSAPAAAPATPAFGRPATAGFGASENSAPFSF